MKIIKQIIKQIILIIGPLILSVLPFIEKLSEDLTDKPIISAIINNTPIIAITIVVTIIIIQFIDLIRNLIFSQEDRAIKKWTKSFLKFITNEHLGGGEYHTRISIFRPEKGWKLIPKYLYFVFIKNFSNNFKNKSWTKYIKHIPKNPNANYLTLYTRYSFPNEEKSYTYFKISKKNEGFNGITDKCYREGKEIEIKTCNISEIQLPPNYEDIKKSRTGQNQNIKQYMKESFIHEDNYQTLLNMNTRANNLYAFAITNEEEDIWGVLIIDNVGDKERSFKTELDPFLEKYAKMFCFTLSSVK